VISSAERLRCDCAREEDRIGTCPLCLPAGAITWLIENGRQLELFEEEGVVTDVRGLESIERSAQAQVKPVLELLEGGLPF